jgi:hypothetical protein
MRTIKGPGVFLAQFAADEAPYDKVMDSFAPEHLRGNPTARRAWAEEQLRFAARASKRIGVDRHVTFPGAPQQRAESSR